MINIKALEGVIALAEAIKTVADGGEEFQNILTTLKQEVEKREATLTAIRKESKEIIVAKNAIIAGNSVHQKLKQEVESIRDSNAEVAGQLKEIQAEQATMSEQLKSKERELKELASNLVEEQNIMVDRTDAITAEIQSKEDKLAEREEAVVKREQEVDGRMAKLTEALK